jgi:hypothetical protein
MNGASGEVRYALIASLDCLPHQVRYAELETGLDESSL